MARVGLIQYAHLNSVRVPQKVLAELRPGLTLLDLGLQKLKVIEKRYKVTPLLAISEQETVLAERAKKFGIEIMPRDQSVIYSDSWDEEQAAFLRLEEKRGGEKLIDRFDQLVNINLVCRPFLRVETIGILCELAHKNKADCYTSVTQKRGVVWNDDESIVIGQGELANTRCNPAYAELAHVGQVCPTSKFFTEAEHTKDIIGLPIKLTAQEKIDIDEPDDLALVQKIWSLFENQYL